MTATSTIRQATTADLEEILRQRCGMYRDMKFDREESLAAMAAVTRPYLAGALANGSFNAWLAAIGNRIAGGGAVLISPAPAHPYDLDCRRATILNVYVYPEFRRRGIARSLMQSMIAWCRHNQFHDVSLHASDDGRHLYESMGFQPGNEMRLRLST